jgi:hypothetical protein
MYTKFNGGKTPYTLPPYPNKKKTVYPSGKML